MWYDKNDDGYLCTQQWFRWKRKWWERERETERESELNDKCTVFNNDFATPLFLSISSSQAYWFVQNQKYLYSKLMRPINEMLSYLVQFNIYKYTYTKDMKCVFLCVSAMSADRENCEWKLRMQVICHDEMLESPWLSFESPLSRFFNSFSFSFSLFLALCLFFIRQIFFFLPMLFSYNFSFCFWTTKKNHNLIFKSCYCDSCNAS